MNKGVRKKKNYEQTLSKVSTSKNQNAIVSKKVMLSKVKEQDDRDVKQKDKNDTRNGVEKSDVSEKPLNSIASKNEAENKKVNDVNIKEKNATLLSKRGDHGKETTGGAGGGILAKVHSDDSGKKNIIDYPVDTSAGMSQRLLNPVKNEKFIPGVVRYSDFPEQYRSTFFDLLVKSGLYTPDATGDVTVEHVTEATAQTVKNNVEVSTVSNELEKQKSVRYGKVNVEGGQVPLAPQTELSNILQTSVLERRAHERDRLSTLVESLVEGNQYESGVVLSLPNYHSDGIDDLFNWIDLGGGGTPPLLFNIMPSDGELFSGSYTIVMSSGSIFGNNHNFEATAETFKQDVPYVEYDWRPDGWISEIHDPRKTEPQTMVTSLSIGGNRESFAGDIERFMSGLKTYITLFNNRRIIMQSPMAARITSKMTKLGTDKGVNLAGILRPAVDENADLQDDNVVANLRYEFFDSKMDGFPIYSIFTEVNEDWARYACDMFAADGSRTLVGKSNIVSYKGQNYRGTAYALIDNFTASLLDLGFNELSGNILTYEDYTTVANALKFQETEINVVDTIRSPIFVRYGPTDDDKATLLFSLLLDNELKGDFMNQAMGLMQAMNLFKMIENKTLFSESALTTVAAGKESSYLILVASYYRLGSLNDFYNLILMEHYSSQFTIRFNVRELLPTYLGLFNLLDILLLFNIAPKLCWSHSAELGKLVNAILACCFPSQYATYRARHGMISEFVDGDWFPTNMVSITQYDVVGGNGTPKQYSVLVVNGRTDDPITNNIYNIADKIVFEGGHVDITRKQDAGFPYTSDLNDYRSSWPNANIGAAFFEENALSRKMRFIIIYISNVIERSRQLSSLDKIQMDRATFKQLIDNLLNLVGPFCSALCRFGNFMTDTIANSYFIWHEWFDGGDYRFAQPSTAFRITRNGEVNILLFNKFDAVVSCSLATYCLINLVGITSTVNAKVNKLSEINRTFTTEIILENIPTNDLVQRYYKYVNKSKKDAEDFSLVRDWFEGVTYAPYIAPFNTSVNNRAAANIGNYIAQLVNSHLFKALLASTSLEFNEASTDIRGDWDVVLTDSMGTNTYNDIDGNAAFGFNLVFLSNATIVYSGICQFLGFSNLSPIFKRVIGFHVSTNLVDTFDAYAVVPEHVYQQILNTPALLRISNVEYEPDPVFPGGDILRNRITLGNDVYYSVGEAASSGRRYLIEIATIAMIRARDVDIIYELMLARVVDLHITDMILEYTVTPVDQMRDYYAFEASKKDSWIRNTLLSGCVSSSILKYNFIDYKFPLRMQNTVSLKANRYVYMSANPPNNIIARSIITNPNVINIVGRDINTRVWNTLADSRFYEDATSILLRRDVRLSNHYNFYYDYIVTELPAVEVVGAAGFQ